jgi:hypothetical protein
MSVGMYTTREFCPKNAKSYLSKGDPYYRKKPVNQRYKGKQFQTNPAKQGQVGAYFTEYKHANESYQDNKRYLQMEPREKRKLGFGSYDARRRDEFTLDVRARQWKEKLKGEKIYAKAALEGSSSLPSLDFGDIGYGEDRERTYRAKYSNNPRMFQTQVPWNLYDIGREASDGSGVTPICNKCSRETFYCRHRVGNGALTARRPGTANTSNTNYGAFDSALFTAKPKYGIINQRKHFYDNSHLSLY